MTETAQACRCIWTGTRHGDTGIPRSWLYRYKVVTLSFDINDGDSHYPVDSDKHPLLSVTFDP